MDDDEVTNLEAICWDASHSTVRWHHALITTTTGEVGTLVRRVLQALPGSGLRAWQELSRWYPPKSAVEGAASMAGIIAPSRAKSIGELQRFIMDWELRVAEHKARRNERVQNSVKVPTLKRMMTTDLAESYIEGPNTHLELRRRFAAFVGVKMIQRSHAPMDIGEVDGEDEGSDDQIVSREAQGGREETKCRHIKEDQGNSLESAAIGEAQEARSRQRARQHEEEEETGIGVLQSGGKGTPSETVPDTSRSRNTDEESSEKGDVCWVEWECELNGAGDEDENIFWKLDGSPQNSASGSVSQLWWTRAQLKSLSIRCLQSCETQRTSQV